jgi:hypothetical protein
LQYQRRIAHLTGKSKSYTTNFLRHYCVYTASTGNGIYYISEVSFTVNKEGGEGLGAPAHAFIPDARKGNDTSNGLYQCNRLYRSPSSEVFHNEIHSFYHRYVTDVAVTCHVELSLSRTARCVCLTALRRL